MRSSSVFFRCLRMCSALSEGGPKSVGKNVVHPREASIRAYSAKVSEDEDS